MMDGNKPNVVNRSASKQSLDKALSLLRSKLAKSTERKSKKNEEERERRINQQCLINFTSLNRKVNASSSFTHTYAFFEIRNALINEDWTLIRMMFPLLLKCLHVQLVIWRFVFLIYLQKNVSNLSNFQEFFEMCIGKNYSDNEFFLEQLMSLHAKI